MFSAASCGVGDVLGRWPSARVGDLSSVCAKVTVVRQKRKKTHRETVMNEPAIGQADLVLKAEGNNGVHVRRMTW